MVISFYCERLMFPCAVTSHINSVMSWGFKCCDKLLILSISVFDDGTVFIICCCSLMLNMLNNSQWADLQEELGWSSVQWSTTSRSAPLKGPILSNDPSETCRVSAVNKEWECVSEAPGSRPTPLYGQPSWWGEEDYGSKVHSSDEAHAGKK